MQIKEYCKATLVKAAMIDLSGYHQIPGAGKIDNYLVEQIFSGEEDRSRLQEESLCNELYLCGNDSKSTIQQPPPF
jgi:hypothetical protein